MGEGYHSRSPEEFRKYLESLNPKTRKKNWIQIMILLDIIILLFVFYMISKKITPDMEISFKPSNKIEYAGLEAYILRSNDSEKDSFSYFMFVKNETDSEILFPSKDSKIIFYIQNNLSEECFQKDIIFPEKKIKPKQKEFFTIQVDHKDVKQTENCKPFYEKVENRSLKHLLAKKDLKFIPELNLIYNNKLYKMRIE
jgi:hypothetical protein